MAINRTVWLTGLKLMGAGATLASTSLVARWFGAGALGAFGVMMTLIAIGSLVSALGSPVFLMTHNALGIGSAEGRLVSVAWILVAWAMVLPTCALIGRNWAWVGFMATAVISWALVQATGAVLVSESKFVANCVVSDAARPSIPLIALALAWAISGGNPSVVVFATSGTVLFGALALGCGAYLWPGQIGGLLRIRGLRRTSRRFMLVTLSALPVALVSLLAGQADRLYLAHLVPLDELGVYVAGQTTVGLVTHLLSAILVQKTPTIVAHLSKEEFSRVTQISLGVSRVSSLVALLAIALVCLGAPLLGAVFQVPGWQVATIGAILLAGTCISMLFGTGVSLMVYEGESSRVRLLLYLGVALVIGVLVGIVLAWHIGICGAALGTAIGTVLQRLLPFLHFRRRGISLLAVGRHKT